MNADLPRDGRAEFDASLERYLDGPMDMGEASAFEARLAMDPALRSRVEAQRSIDASLRSAFAPDAAGLALHEPRGRSIVARIGWWRFAAVLALGALAVATYLLRARYMHGDRMEPLAAYRQIADEGMVPHVVCTTPDTFADFTLKQFGHKVQMSAPATVTLVGWSYDPVVLSENSCALLAKVGRDDVVVFMDDASKDRSIALRSSGPGLHVFKRVAAGLVFYEVTPREQPALLEGFKACEGQGPIRESGR